MLFANRPIDPMPALETELDAADATVPAPDIAPLDARRHAERVERSRKARERRRANRTIAAQRERKEKHEAALRRQALVARKGAARVAAQAAKRVQGR